MQEALGKMVKLTETAPLNLGIVARAASSFRELVVSPVHVFVERHEHLVRQRTVEIKKNVRFEDGDILSVRGALVVIDDEEMTIPRSEVVLSEAPIVC